MGSKRSKVSPPRCSIEPRLSPQSADPPVRPDALTTNYRAEGRRTRGRGQPGRKTHPTRPQNPPARRLTAPTQQWTGAHGVGCRKSRVIGPDARRAAADAGSASNLPLGARRRPNGASLALHASERPFASGRWPSGEKVAERRPAVRSGVASQSLRQPPTGHILDQAPSQAATADGRVASASQHRPFVRHGHLMGSDII
jgi:hypothetical protein